MTFLDALKSGRPMRRKSQWAWCPWRHLGNEHVFDKKPVWRRIDTGDQMGISRDDYLADDWEVMP